MSKRPTYSLTQGHSPLISTGGSAVLISSTVGNIHTTERPPLIKKCVEDGLCVKDHDASEICAACLEAAQMSVPICAAALGLVHGRVMHGSQAGPLKTKCSEPLRYIDHLPLGSGSVL
jgi:hypothetical protein